MNGRIDQDFGDIGSVSLIANYNENRNNFINRVTLAQFNQRSLPVYNGEEFLAEAVPPRVCRCSSRKSRNSERRKK